MAEIIIRTNMTEIPTNCKECYFSIKSFMTSDLGCPIIKDWITKSELKAGKVKLDNCPLEKTDAKIQ